MRSVPLVPAVLAALVLVAGPAAAQSPSPTPTAPVTPGPSFGAAWNSVSCDDFDINEKVAAISDCGYVTVPENRVAGTDRTIQLAVIRLRSTSADPGTPLFIGSGGPGGSNFDFLSKEVLAKGVDYTAMAAPILADRDIVRWSERGTLFAKPFLDCPAYDAIDRGRAANGWTRKETDAQITSTLTACADAFKAQGVDLAGYTTDQNAADIVDVKGALGYDTIDYYGQSYGTLLGQFLLRNHPEIVEAIVLDGIVPVDQTNYHQLVDMPAAFQRLYDACDAQATCKAQYPDLEQTVKQLVAKLDKDPLTVTVKAADGTDQTLSLDSKFALDYLVTQLYGGGTNVPQAATAILRDPAKYAAELTPGAGSGTFARIQHFAINCSDDPDTSMEPFKLQDDPAYLRDWLYDDGIREVLACKVLGVPQLPATSDEPVRSDVPALLLNGQLDPATAAANGHIVEQSLPNTQYVLFPAGGHVQDQDPCAVGIIAAFLKDPAATVDTSCITPAGQLAALTPTTFTSTDGSATLTLKIVRPTWRDAGNGTWDYQGQVQLNVQVLPAATTPDQAVKDALKPIAAVEDTQIADGDPVVGRPTRIASLEAEVQGQKVAADSFAFTTPAATYVVSFLGLPPTGSGLRALYPQILKTISVDPAP